MQIPHHPWVILYIKMLHVARWCESKVDGRLIQVAVVELSVERVLAVRTSVSDCSKIVCACLSWVALLRAVMRILGPGGSVRGPARRPLNRICAIRVMHSAVSAASRAVGHALDVLREEVVLKEHVSAPLGCYCLFCPKLP